MTMLPIQPSPIVSYLRVGRLLYASLVLFILESWIYGVQLMKSIHSESIFWIVFWTVFFLFSFVHIYLVLMDGWSRYQNYKRIKDQFFIHGFNKKITLLYVGSKCQRMAAETAGEELGIKEQVQQCYRDFGVKWYHFIPYFMVKEPLFLFKKKFWSRTFLEEAYKPKFDYRAMTKSQII